MAPILTLEQASYHRGSRPILKALSVSINEGKFIGLIGPNGAGKSTLLRLMARLLKPDGGAVLFRGRDLGGMSDLAVAKAITYMPQSTQLDYAFTVRHVVSMGRHPHRKRWQLLTRADEEIITEAMVKTGILHLQHRYVPSLSGGERQLVFLARSIAQQSDVILLDEPTSDLDIYHQVQISELIRGLVAEGRTIVAAIHDINLAARYCDEVMLLKDGAVAFKGRPAEAITAATLREVFQTQVYVFEDPFLAKRQVIPYAGEEAKHTVGGV